MMRHILALQLLAAALMLAGAMPAPAQMIYAPQNEGTRVPGGPSRVPDRQPERQPEPRRPRVPNPGPGFGIIALPPPVIYAPPPYEEYDEPPPRRERPAARPAQKKPAAKPAAPRQQAKKPPPPAKPATTAARPPVVPPVVVAPDQVPDEVVFELRPDISQAEVDAVMRRFALTPIARIDIALLGTSIQHARVSRGSRVETVVRQLAGDSRVASAQPNFVFAGQTGAVEAPEMAGAQYAPEKLKIPEAHRLASGANVVVAVIDSGVDPAHPELGSSLIDIGEPAAPHSHGTGMAGAIAAHVKLVGIAPGARILAIDALKYDRTGGAKGTSIDIIRALDTAAQRDARVVNLSFAGPRDELMARALRALHMRGAVLVAAAGNAGPKSKPLFPAAHPDVIAVTATDANDAIYANANVGEQIGVAAPGVDVLVPAPNGAYQVLSGTSLASAHVSGVAALMLERRPDLDPDAIRALLTGTARDLGKPGLDAIFGAGLVDASAAVAKAEEGGAAAAVR